MGFLDRVQSKLKSNNIAEWKALNDIKQIDQLKAISKEKPVVIFKHSTTCGISANAKFRLEGDWADVKSNIDFYYLDLLSYRPVSNLIAEEFGVVHQSPQIIIIHDERAVYNTSHHRISIADLNTALDAV